MNDKVRVGGKLIISGEHAVVYGKPAVVARIGLSVEVKCGVLQEPIVKVTDTNLVKTWKYTIEVILKYLHSTEELWKKYEESGDFKKLALLARKDEMFVVKLASGKAIEKFGIENGFELAVNSLLPRGSGLGSSATISTAVILGVGKCFGSVIEKDELSGLVFEIEKFVHGNPSGIDNTAVVYGGVIEFSKRNGFKFRKIEVRRKLPEVLLIQSGIPLESTGEMVALVAEKYHRNKDKFRSIMDNIGHVTNEMVQTLEGGEVDGELIRANERLLEELGVVSERAKKIVRLIEMVGGVAKVCGAGGIRQGSGIILAYHENSEVLEKLSLKEQWETYKTLLGE